MRTFTQETGTGAVLMLDNIDTDQIIPGHSMMKLQTRGYGDELFFNWRYLPDGTVNPDFVLNQPPFDKAAFLVAGHNFGCGSSREWAAWAIRDFGIRAIVAPSFGPTFIRNCYNNGLLPLALPEPAVAALADVLRANGHVMRIDLESLTLAVGEHFTMAFTLADADRERLLKGLDQIEVGARLRYEIRREFAPYIGIEQSWRTGQSADFARARGEDPSATSFIAGIRFWF